MDAIPTVELRPKKIEELNDQPIIETKMCLSDDGNWFIHRTVITDIKSLAYMAKVFRTMVKNETTSDD